MHSLDEMASLTGTIEQLQLRAQNDHEGMLSAFVSGVRSQGLYEDVFLHELLQNADDAMHRNRDNDHALELFLSENYFVIQYAGVPFTPDNLKTLCTVFDGKNTKHTQSEQTGKKGVGFKSVFFVSDNVTIQSGEERFSFNKQAEFWQGREDDYPWQITPVEADEKISASEIKITQQKSIRIILQLKPGKYSSCKKNIENFFKNSLNKIFFRAINKIAYKNVKDNTAIETRCIAKSLTHDGSQKEVKVHVSAAKSRTITFRVHTQYVAIPSELLEQIKEDELIKREGIYPKYQRSQKLKIEYAYRVDKNNNIIPPKSSRMFVTLPTRVTQDGSFHVNTDLVLSLDRSSLHQNKSAKLWNQFVFRSIYEQQVHVLEAIAQSDNYLQVLSVLPPKELVHYEQSFSDDEQQLSAALASAVRKAKLLRNRDNHLISTAESNLDPYDFCFPYVPKKSQRLFVNEAYQEHKEVLEALGVGIIKLKSILGIIKKIAARQATTATDNQQLLRKLHQLYTSLPITEQQPLLDECQQLTLVLGNDGKLHKPSEIFITDKSMAAFEASGLFTFIHPENSIPSFTEQLAGKFIGQRLSVSSAIAYANKFDLSQHVKFISVLIEVFPKLSEQEQKELSKLQFYSRPVKAKTTKRKLASKLYITPTGQDEFRLEAILPEYPAILHPDYPRGQDADKFYAACKMQTELNKQNIEEVVRHANQSSHLLQFTVELAKLSQQQRYADLLTPELPLLCHVKETKQLQNVTECYLADCYEPSLALEEQNVPLKFISDTYLLHTTKDDSLTAQDWQAFWLSLGAYENIELITRRRVQCSDLNGWERDYFNDAFAKHIPAASQGYKTQASLNKLYTFPFAEELLQTPFIWQLLSTHWHSVIDEEVSFYQSYLRHHFPITDTSLLYLARRAIDAQFGKFAAQLYMPSIYAILRTVTTDVTDISSIADLDDEQLQRIGLSKRLRKDDAIALLKKLCETDIRVTQQAKLIGLIYSSLVSHESTDDDSSEELALPTKLLSMDGNVKSHDELIIFTQPNWLNKPNHPRLLLIDNAMCKDELKQLGALLNVAVVTPEDVRVNSTIADEYHPLVASFAKHLLDVALLTSDGGDDELSSIAEHYTQIRSAFAKLTIQSCAEIKIMSADIELGSVTNWYEADSNKLYVAGTSWTNERLLLLERLLSALQLTCDMTSLLDVLLNDLDIASMQEKYPIYAHYKELQTLCEPKRKRQDAEEPKKRARTKEEKSSVQQEAAASTSNDYKPQRYAEIGWPAEKKVYQYLVSDITASFSDSDSSSTSVTNDKGQLVCQGGSQSIRLTWFNFTKDTESKMPYDMVKLTYHGNEIISRDFYEVKASGVVTEGTITTYFSEPEICLMARCSNTTDTLRLGTNEIQTKPINRYHLFTVKKARDGSWNAVIQQRPFMTYLRQPRYFKAGEKRIPIEYPHASEASISLN